ncbi:MAG TPA: DUF4136 domain-containing protein [Allosphingosinicella sp.]|nr:DUF4136 domain-containing protein [Allosphingosinicella sp.]
MKAFFVRSTGLVMAAALAGCTTAESGGGGIEVSRFHLGQPIARGSIAVETFATPDAGGPEFKTYAAAVERQLARLGWTVVNTLGKSEQVALVGIQHTAYQAPPRRGPVSVGVGGGTGGYGSGVGVGVGFDLGGGGSAGRATTTLQVRIKRRSDGTVFWEGRATGDARADRPQGQPEALADSLAEAVFRDFPGESGRTIRIR